MAKLYERSYVAHSGIVVRVLAVVSKVLSSVSSPKAIQLPSIIAIPGTTFPKGDEQRSTQVVALELIQTSAPSVFMISYVGKVLISQIMPKS